MWKNTKKNGEDGVKDTLQNPAIGVLSEMLDYFTPGTAWDNGTILNSAMHEMNLKETAKSIRIVHRQRKNWRSMMIYMTAITV